MTLFSIPLMLYIAMGNDGVVLRYTIGGEGVDDPVNISSIKNLLSSMNEKTTISFENVQTTEKALQIYNTKEQLVNEIPIRGNQHSVVWNSTGFDDNLALNGIYHYRIMTNDEVISNKLLLLG